jgi:tetratricopeptide (TPR) repeat protein/DNA-binding XRE family transcriptional regulator
MRREQRLARLFRALSGDSQDRLAEALGSARSLVAQIELGDVVASPEQLAVMARRAGLSVADGDEVLGVVDRRRRRRRRWGRGRTAEERLDRMAEAVRSHAGAVYERLLTLPRPESLPRPEDRAEAEELFARLHGLAAEVRLAVVRVSEQFQTWALCERVCEASEREASRDVEAAATWARFAEEVAQRVRGPEDWRTRIQGYSAGFAANVLRVQGELAASAARFEEAKRLWNAGSDPAGLLDPGRLLDLEASLLKDQRRLPEALARLDEAAAVGRRPERALIKKGITLEKMGAYDRAVESLLRAAPLIDRQSDPRLWYNQRFNLAVNFCHLGRCGDATELVPEIRRVAGELGDEIFLLRLTWLEGRIAAGLGRREEALKLLAEARREFAARGMTYDVALALLEEAVLLLEEGRSAEVKALAAELIQVFEANGVHREALAALRLFHEAAEREEATAETARRVLRFLFRARHDPEVRFEG